ncbi:serine protease [Alcaligenes faecalis subsp. phenolicus]|uniref:S1 family peptidase n=1 Tax=Alcaligenes nematophilus TaxID=2994643 RepID=UPI002AA4E1CB|nr:serine protease [Alcaligenes phenolicus]
MTRSLEESIIQTTMLIEAFHGNATGRGTGRGTGFQLGVMMADQYIIPLLITNKHVVRGAESIKIHFSLSDPSDYEKKIGVASCHITSEWEKLWIPHPDASVDLCALSLGGVFLQLQKQGRTAYGMSFAETDIIDSASLANLTPIEDVLMVGYPIGLRDEIHNQPVVRRGITATDPRLDFRGKKEFLIDCACWPGSSGSPVLLKTQGLKTQGSSISIGASRTFLVGALYSGPTHTSSGTVEFNPIPTSTSATVTTHQMIHLGNVINSTRIRELIEAAKTPPKGNLNCQLLFEFKEYKK